MVRCQCTCPPKIPVPSVCSKLAFIVLGGAAVAGYFAYFRNVYGDYWKAEAEAEEEEDTSLRTKRPSFFFRKRKRSSTKRPSSVKSAVSEGKRSSVELTSLPGEELEAEEKSVEKSVVSEEKRPSIVASEGKRSSIAVSEGKRSSVAVSEGKRSSVAVSEGKRSSVAVSEGKRSSVVQESPPHSEEKPAEEISIPSTEEIPVEESESEESLIDWDLLNVQARIRGFLIRIRRERLLLEIIREVAAVTIQRSWRKTKLEKHVQFEERLYAHSICRDLVWRIYQDISATYIQRWWRRVSQHKKPPYDSDSASVGKYHNTKKYTRTELSLDYFILEHAHVVDKWWWEARRKNRFKEFICGPNGFRNQMLGHLICRMLVLSILRDVAAKVIQTWWKKAKTQKKAASKNVRFKDDDDSASYSSKHKEELHNQYESSTPKGQSNVAAKEEIFYQDKQQKNTYNLVHMKHQYNDVNIMHQVVKETFNPLTDKQIESPNDLFQVKSQHQKSVEECKLTSQQEQGEACIAIQRWWRNILHTNEKLQKQITLAKSAEHTFPSRSLIILQPDYQLPQNTINAFEAISNDKKQVNVPGLIVPDTKIINFEFHYHGCVTQLFAKMDYIPLAMEPETKDMVASKIIYRIVTNHHHTGRRVQEGRSNEMPIACNFLKNNIEKFFSELKKDLAASKIESWWRMVQAKTYKFHSKTLNDSFIIESLNLKTTTEEIKSLVKVQALVRAFLCSMFVFAAVERISKVLCVIAIQSWWKGQLVRQSLQLQRAAKHIKAWWKQRTVNTLKDVCHLESTPTKIFGNGKLNHEYCFLPFDNNRMEIAALLVHNQFKQNQLITQFSDYSQDLEFYQ